MFPISSDAGLRVGEVVLKNAWVLEWSQSQQAFHIETLIDALQGSILGFLHGGKTGDYIILGLYATREEADGFYDIMVARMRQWGMSSLTVDDLLDED